MLEAFRNKNLLFVIALFSLLLATVVSSPFNTTIGSHWIYLPVNIGLVLALWWGPRVFLAVYANALFSLYLFDVPLTPIYVLYALPETLQVILGYSLISDRFKKVKAWKAHPKHIGLFCVYGFVIPAIFKGVFQQILFIMTGLTDFVYLLLNLYQTILGDLLGAVGVGLPILVLLTPKLFKQGLSKFNFEPIDTRYTKMVAVQEFIIGITIMAGMLLVTLFTDITKTWFLLGIALLVMSAWYGIFAAIALNSWLFFLFGIIPRYFLGRTEPVSSAELSHYSTVLSLCFCSVVTGSAISSLRSKINALKTAECELKLEKNRAERASNAKSEFLARMSHEIRTPLNAVLGMLELLKETSLNKDQERYINLFSHAGENLKALINDLLDFSKIEAKALNTEKTSYDLNNTIRSVYEILQLKAEEKGISYNLITDPQIPTAQIGDPTRLRQILFNLIGNAIKFTKEGSVNIITKLQDDSQFSISIEDTGIGIPRDKMNQLFTPFFQGDDSITREYGGTGLGLVISKNLAEILGGSLNMKSVLGRGSTFKLNLPNIPDPHPVQTTRDRSYNPWENYQGRKFNILLVDDSEDNRVLICHYLKNLPFTCDEAANGQEAYDKFQTNNYDLVFMDIQMPIMTGYRATELIRHYEDKNKLIRTPIIALTATAVVEDLQKTLNAGCDAYAVKPVKRKEMLDILSQHLIKTQTQTQTQAQDQNQSHNKSQEQFHSVDQSQSVDQDQDQPQQLSENKREIPGV